MFVWLLKPSSEVEFRIPTYGWIASLCFGEIVRFVNAVSPTAHYNTGVEGY